MVQSLRKHGLLGSIKSVEMCHAAPASPGRKCSAGKGAPPPAAQAQAPYFRTPPKGKTFSPIVASTLFQSVRLNLGIMIFTGGINNLPFVKTL